MQLPARAQTLPELRRRRAESLSRLRTVEHWRRLVAARLDLAVAAVTDIEEQLPFPVGGPDPLPGLRDLLGIPRCDARLAESALLPQLRVALRELDRHAAALRLDIDAATRLLVDELAGHRWSDAAAC